MADLNDTAGWPGIYRIEETDRVVGGDPAEFPAKGVANRSAQELASRTRYLRDRVKNFDFTCAKVSDLNTINQQGFYSFDSVAANVPQIEDGRLIHLIEENGEASQLVFLDNRGLFHRTRNVSAGENWGAWDRIWTAETDGHNSGMDADTVDGVHLASLLRKDQNGTFAAALTIAGILTMGANINMNGNSLLGVDKVDFGGSGDSVRWVTGLGLEFFENGVLVARIGGTSLIKNNFEVEGHMTAEGGRVYHMNNILGSVGVTGGVPTGAIMQRGSNANGDFVRFADGTQICVSPNFGNIDVTTAAGGIVRNVSPINWNFPVNFGGSDTISGSVTSNGNSQTHWASFRVTGSSSADITVFAPAATTGRTVRALAIGRWF